MLSQQWFGWHMICTVTWHCYVSSPLPHMTKTTKQYNGIFNFFAWNPKTTSTAKNIGASIWTPLNWDQKSVTMSMADNGI